MELGLLIIAGYTIAVFTLVSRVGRIRRNRQRLTGRGGDFE